MRLVKLYQQYFLHLYILVRVCGHVEAYGLLRAGMTQLSHETFLNALELGRKMLITLGMHSYQTQRTQLYFRRLGVHMLRGLIPIHTDTIQTSRARGARHELEGIFQREMQ